jgi:hypothetical protein
MSRTPSSARAGAAAAYGPAERRDPGRRHRARRQPGIRWDPPWGEGCLGRGLLPGLLGFDGAASEADRIITGEGKLDEQTLSGKLPLAVARRAGRLPVHVVVGNNALGRPDLPEHGIERIWALSAISGRDTSRNPGLSAALLTQIGRRIAQANEREGSRGVAVPRSQLPALS